MIYLIMYPIIILCLLGMITMALRHPDNCQCPGCLK